MRSAAPARSPIRNSTFTSTLPRPEFSPFPTDVRSAAATRTSRPRRPRSACSSRTTGRSNRPFADQPAASAGTSTPMPRTMIFVTPQKAVDALQALAAIQLMPAGAGSTSTTTFRPVTTGRSTGTISLRASAFPTISMPISARCSSAAMGAITTGHYSARRLKKACSPNTRRVKSSFPPTGSRSTDSRRSSGIRTS